MQRDAGVRRAGVMEMLLPALRIPCRYGRAGVLRGGAGRRPAGAGIFNNE